MGIHFIVWFCGGGNWKRSLWQGWISVPVGCTRRWGVQDEREMNIQVDWGELLGFQGRSVGYVIRVSGYCSIPGGCYTGRVAPY